jgi:hypothetical protein
MNEQKTEAFWTTPRHVLPTWQDRVETVLNKMYDGYMALWDLMPAVAAFAFLLWIINLFSRTR